MLSDKELRDEVYEFVSMNIPIPESGSGTREAIFHFVKGCIEQSKPKANEGKIERLLDYIDKAETIMVDGLLFTKLDPTKLSDLHLAAIPELAAIREKIKWLEGIKVDVLQATIAEQRKEIETLKQLVNISTPPVSALSALEQKEGE